ncbi:kinase-like protein [Lentinus tigrinus ALCF2SS1-7]|uniref:cAMP-dependent protein kinase n=1 Tax=Lentinus tigrinus ALCF2SS1-6 TaxID=1328759 RepID=A0A5C2SRJ9_9APHY|nr:kinase-like protein [Lentinus tigrinus ALCF2SS1-6]RPD80406.1 kinase-like protein [Lentinus tigrinus ALCF2SS1-7]
MTPTLRVERTNNSSTRARRARTTDSGFQSTTNSRRSTPRRTPVVSSSRYTLDRANIPNHEDCRTGNQTFYAEISKGKRPIADLRDLECISTLGTGAWGAVYLVKVKRRFGKPTGKAGALLALKGVEKRAYRDLERNDQREDRWEAAEGKNYERRALASLPWNPFIVGLLDAYTDPRNLYLLLELAPRGCLYDILGEPLPPDAAKFYFANLVLALEFLHSHGLVHRDIKNENILIGADGYAMITDFGFSQFVPESEEWARLGTIAFVSPEIATCTTNTTEAKLASDWWSAACSLFEMLTTDMPFHPKGNQGYKELVEEHRQRNIPWPDSFDDQARDLISRMLNPELSSRYGARTIPAGNGSQINQEVRSHEFMRSVRWDRIEARIERAPKWPDSVPLLTAGWDDRSLPEQKKVPGLQLKRRFPGPQSEVSGDFRADRPSKRQRTGVLTETAAI